MEIKIIRNVFTENTTISDWFTDNIFDCHTLEDKDRGLHNKMTLEETNKIKVYGDTCIGYGKYEVDITYSNKFQIHYPLVLNVVGFSGIRIHCGVNKNHTLGCLLTGESVVKDGLKNSQVAFYKVFFKMLSYKTSPPIASELIALHKAKNAGGFAKLYNANKNSNKIYIEYLKP